MAGTEKTGFFAKLKDGLKKTRDNLYVAFSGATIIDEDFYDDLEEVMIMSDMGVELSESVIDQLREVSETKHISYPTVLRRELVRIFKEEMDVTEADYEFERRKSVVLVTGVNGVGKTTSIGKLASHYKAEGKRVLLAAADTFRAAAIEQLTEWSNRAGVPIIAQKEGSDPSAVIFDAVTAAKSRNVDILLCDTAGRLHNKKNLMEELRKMNRIIDQVYPEAFRENLLVLDAATGQNAISQAKEFMDVTNITGIILTKMDGTAKGGIAIAIQKELGIPVKYIGVGEGIDDLMRFNSEDFVDALLADD
ncbi:MAG: signal recognition particle-docking protein FtsY [Lachnospiraceae bacterium]|nr:signal recognition particle-docking protein FtsY [Lachnospiraceae bacterium]